MEGETKEKASEEDAQKIAQKVLHSHEEIVGFRDSDVQGLMDSMGTAIEKGEASFEHAGLLGVNLKAALTDEDEVVEEGEKADIDTGVSREATSSQKRKDSPKDPAKEPKSAKKQKFFSVSQVAQAQTSLRTKCQQAETEGWKLVTEIKEKLKKHADLEVDASKLFMVARAWLRCSELVLEGNSRALRSHLLSLKARSTNPAEAAPMERFEELCTIAAVQDKAVLFECCESQEQVKELWAEVNPSFQRWRELNQASRQNMTSIEAMAKARKGASQEKAKEESSKKKSRKCAGDGGSSKGFLLATRLQ